MPGGIVCILGPVEIVESDGSIRCVRNASRRRLVAILACFRGQTVAVDRLAELCGIGRGGVRTSICRLRRDIDDTALRTTPPGYRLERAATDIGRIEDRLARITRGTTEHPAPPSDVPSDDLLLLTQQWRGLALEEFRTEPWALAEAARLDELQGRLVEELAMRLLAEQRADEAVGPLFAQVMNTPLRDRSQRLLMLALARSGRTTEALRTYERYRRTLADLGTEPPLGASTLDRLIAGGRSLDTVSV